MNELKYFIAFASGITIGSLVTYKALDKKYEKRAEDEINSVKERFSRMKQKDNHSKDIKEKKRMLEQNGSIISSQGYGINENGTVDYSNISKPKEKDNMNDIEHEDIFIIEPNEFGEDENIECATLYYYADGVSIKEDTWYKLKNGEFVEVNWEEIE